MTIDISTSDLPPPLGERHILQPQEELRVEVAFLRSCTICLQKGSAELWGCELAVGKLYSVGGCKLALFSWHGCVIDVHGDVDVAYISDETDSNVAYVNTHAQLEALRDEALQTSGMGPRVMVVGPPESGKTSLCKALVAYAAKVGRTPLWLDLDPKENALSVPGTLCIVPVTMGAVAPETYATCGIPPNSCPPLCVWHGLEFHPELFRAQVDRLAKNIDRRLQNDDLERSSGLIVDTNGWIEDEGYQLLLHAADSLQISVLLIMGHDRLYSMMTTHYRQVGRDVKIIKLPRSGGIVSRSTAFLRHARSRAVKRYFYGDLVDPPITATSGPSSAAASTSATSVAASITTATTLGKVPQLTPCLLHLNFSQVTIYRLSSIALSASLLPVAQAQTTDSIQLQEVDINETIQHSLLAVCHPAAVSAFEASGRARDLVTAGVAGFCAVERVIMETDMLHLLSPCAGSLPSHTLVLGDVTWMD